MYHTFNLFFHFLSKSQFGITIYIYVVIDIINLKLEFISIHKGQCTINFMSALHHLKFKPIKSVNQTVLD